MKSLPITFPDILRIFLNFSENDLCKYCAEMQAVHFGASEKLASLHSSVSWLHCG